MGLRQGCPLFLYLFIICSDVLSRSLRAACTVRELEAYVPALGAQPISHLLFADDCLLLTRARIADAQAIRQVLATYCHPSGQRVNAQKSTISFSPSTPPGIRRGVRRILEMPEQDGTWTYLGVSITGRRLRVSECTGMVQRVQSRLEGWRAVSLSMMGRVTLIRSVLGSMPIYLMANKVVPRSVLLKIERLLRGFLWGSLGGGRGVHLVAWESVCLPLREGGLGVLSLLEKRELLLTRHASRFILEPQGFWSRIMIARYGRAGLKGWARGGWSCSFLWREIARYVPMVSDHTRWLIGDGRSIDVTGDPWVDVLPLRLWPTTVSVDAKEGLHVCDLMSPEEADWDEIRLARFFGEHLAERVRSLSLPRSGGPDVQVWSSSTSPRVRMC
ncbi:uncharacterized protein LOC120105093 [Phoenix dactylifera]|uniref:Uncharacterized protein LOC120105093 n=1 Tax=Phoenix dactylifera TaxID=42345 RepID=A0A8B8ZIJ1_PHODC|nr:uncharacterized protein LOC120105093 [Phoenix dactylifera]